MPAELGTAPDLCAHATCAEVLPGADSFSQRMGRPPYVEGYRTFVLTFSERWFPPKVVRLWTELHPFERMGLVLAYFRRAGGYTALGTESVRGLLRPEDDKYAATTPLSDPVYAVWGMKV